MWPVSLHGFDYRAQGREGDDARLRGFLGGGYADDADLHRIAERIGLLHQLGRRATASPPRRRAPARIPSRRRRGLDTSRCTSANISTGVPVDADESVARLEAGDGGRAVRAPPSATTGSETNLP